MSPLLASLNEALAYANSQMDLAETARDYAQVYYHECARRVIAAQDAVRRQENLEEEATRLQA